MDDSFDYGMAILNQQSDQSMMQVAANPPDVLGPSTRAMIVKNESRSARDQKSWEGLGIEFHFDCHRAGRIGNRW